MEHFSGIGMHSRVFRQNGLRAAEVDKIHGAGHDILKESGFGYLGLNCFSRRKCDEHLQCLFEILGPVEALRCYHPDG